MNRSPQQASVADASDADRPDRSGEAAAEPEIDILDMGDELVEDDAGDGTVQAIEGEAGDRTVQVEDPGSADRDPDLSGRVRTRRATVVSPIPAMLAASMTTVPEGKQPTPLPGHLSAVVSGPGSAIETGDGYTVEVERGDDADCYNRVSDLIAATRAAFEGRDFHIAARMAEEALSAGEAQGTASALELLSTAQPLFERVFAAFVGPLGATPQLARPWEEIVAHRLAGSTRSFLSRIDGVRTLEQTLGHSSIPPQHALRIAASALRAGFIRVP